MQKIHPKGKHIHKGKHDHNHLPVDYVGNSATALWNLGKKEKEKRMRVNNTETFPICVGRGHNNMY
jgi:hypothetical protein